MSSGWLDVGVLVAIIGAIVAVANLRASPYGELRGRVLDLEAKDEKKSTELETMRLTIGELRTTGEQQATRIVALDADVGVLAGELWEVHQWDGKPPPPTISSAAFEIMLRRRPIDLPHGLGD